MADDFPEFDIELDRTLRQIMGEISHLARPKLHVFVLEFTPGQGWTCIIQESRRTQACVGSDYDTPRKAISQAIISLYKKNEAEKPYDKPVYRSADMERIMKESGVQ